MSNRPSFLANHEEMLTVLEPEAEGVIQASHPTVFPNINSTDQLAQIKNSPT